MRSLALASILVFGAASPPAQDANTAGDFVVRCGKLYRGKGPALENALLVVRGGRIQQVLQGVSPPDDLPLIDAGDKVVMPGIVAADTDLSGHGDAPQTVTPDFVAIDGFDYLRSYRLALSGGVTTVYLSPGRNRLIPGQGSVVKLYGDDIVQRTLAERACLRITLGRESTQSPPLFEPTPHPTADDPLLPARRQYPSSRLSQLATLRELFHDAAASNGTNGGLTEPGAVEAGFETEYGSGALIEVATGELPLRVAAREAADIRRAVLFARQLGVPVVLENPYEIAPVSDYASRNRASAVFRIPINLSGSNPGGEDRRRKDDVRNRPENAGIAERAGMTVALAPNRNSELADVLLVAGIAVRYGMSEDAALAGITEAAATVLGVDDRVGTLENGKDADLLILSGEPFAVGTMVEKTYVDGHLAYERQTDDDLLAVRVGKIMTAEGRTLRDGVVLVADGKIKGVGEDLAIPYGSRIISVPDGVVVPGFIDANTSLGLSGDGVGIPSGSADQRIADVVEVGDPLFEEALAGGLTTLLVSGRDGGPVSGRISAIKPGAVDHDGLVLRDIAGIRLVFDAIDDPEAKPIKSQIDAGKKYIEAWQRYEKAVADWKAGKRDKPPEEAEAPSQAPPPVDPVSGTWELDVEVDLPVEIGITLELKLAGSNVTGTAIMSFRGQETPPAEIQQGSFVNGTIKLTVAVMGDSGTLEGTVTADRMSGTFSARGGQVSGTFDGERTAKPGRPGATPAVAEDDGEPKKPVVNEALEPIRAWIEKRIPAVVKTNRAPAIRNLIAFFEKEQLPYVLHGVDDAIETPAILGDDPPNIMLGPNLVRRDHGEVVNAAATIADQGAPLAIVTGDTAGSRYLPLHAAHAIRYGMDPEAALRAMTIGPAKMFGIDDRVGSLARGKDADFVVFSGGPFEPTSRVLLVIAGGRVVVDNRQEDER